jgi:asparagine synthase (glutamine-hydrolysing)
MLRGDVAAHFVPRTVRRFRARRTDGVNALQDWVSATALRPEIVATLDLPAMLPHLDEQRARDRRSIALELRRHYAGQADGAHALWALTGVESRDPTADRRLIEVAMRQPEWVRRQGGTTRAVVRDAMADRLPVSIVGRTRRGEQLPEWLDLMTTARPGIAAELDLLEGHARSAELIDASRLRKLVDEWPARERNADIDTIRNYRHALLRALVVSRFLRWFEERARRR